LAQAVQCLPIKHSSQLKLQYHQKKKKKKKQALQAEGQCQVSPSPSPHHPILLQSSTLTACSSLLLHNWAHLLAMSSTFTNAVLPVSPAHKLTLMSFHVIYFASLTRKTKSARCESRRGVRCGGEQPTSEEGGDFPGNQAGQSHSCPATLSQLAH
jgi:hypothetical protein